MFMMYRLIKIISFDDCSNSNYSQTWQYLTLVNRAYKVGRYHEIYYKIKYVVRNQLNC